MKDIKLRLENTLSRRIEEFTPISAKEVKMYTCGPTVYGRAHIGNLRAYVHADIVKRTLEFIGYKVKHVMNITDVGHLTSDADEGEDKLQQSAKKENTTAWKISKRYTKTFLSDLKRINVILPNILAKATDNIPEQIELIKKLEGKRFTYITDDGVYFDTSKLSDYGKLALLDIKGLSEGKRITMGGKRNKTDFALWKLSKPNEKRDMEWKSPWGIGFPGWHIECSAMSMKYLGDQFDIHTGGIDHIPVHHTNEIAQSESATGKKPFVKFWLHSEFLISKSGEKMSKSLGNIIDLDTLQELGVEPMAFRYFCLNASYKSKLQLGDDSLKGAQTGYDNLKSVVSEIRREVKVRNKIKLGELGNLYLNKFTNAVADNLNTPKGLSVLWGMLKDIKLPKNEKYYLAIKFDKVLGLELAKSNKLKKVKIPTEILALVREREKYRKEKDWGRADFIRLKIIDKGYEPLDTPSGTGVKKVTNF